MNSPTFILTTAPPPPHFAPEELPPDQGADEAVAADQPIDQPIEHIEFEPAEDYDNAENPDEAEHFIANDPENPIQEVEQPVDAIDQGADAPDPGPDQGADIAHTYNLRPRGLPSTQTFNRAMDTPHDGRSYFPPTQLVQMATDSVSNANPQDDQRHFVFDFVLTHIATTSRFAQTRRGC